MSNNQRPDRVNVEYLNNAWIVKNQGDSSILFKSHNKSDAEKFARDIADSYNLNIKVYSKNENSSSPVTAPQKLKVDVEKRDGQWVVRKSGEHSNLFTSDSKDEAVDYAYSLDEGNGLDLHIDKG